MGRRERNAWIEHAKERVLSNAKQADTCAVELMSLYDETAAQLEDEIYALFQKYAVDNKLTSTEASKLLSGGEYSRWRKRIEHYVTEAETDSAVLRELNTLAMKSRISRKEAMLTEVYHAMALLSGETESKLTELLSDIYKTNYYRGCFELQSVIGVAFDVSRIRQDELEMILKHPWSGKNFSRALWDNTDKLAALARRELSLGVASGKGVEQMAKEIDSVMHKGRYAAERLVRTEASYFANQGELRSYRELGVERYEYLGGGCEICQELNGTAFSLSEAETGVNFPPIHPNCKCTIIARPKIDLLKNRQGQNPLSENARFEAWKQEHVKDITAPEASGDLMGQAKSFELSARGKELKRKQKKDPASGAVKLKVYKVDGAEKLYTETNSPDAQRTISYLKTQLPYLEKGHGSVKEVIVTGDRVFKEIAAYDHANHRLYISERVTDEGYLKELASKDIFAARTTGEILLHELTHKDHWDAVERFYNTNREKYGTIEAAKSALEEDLRKYVKAQRARDPFYVARVVSENAQLAVEKRSLNELIADGEVLMERGELNDAELARLIGGMLK